MGLADAAIEWLGSRWELTLLATTYAFWFWWLSNAVKETRSKTSLVNFLRFRQAGRTYDALVRWLIGVTDKWFLTPVQLENDFDKRPSWTSGLFDKMLVAAFVYPFLLVHVQWVLSGGELGFNEAIITDPQAPWWARLSSTAVFVVCIAVYFSPVAHRRKTLSIVALSALIFASTCVYFLSIRADWFPIVLMSLVFVFILIHFFVLVTPPTTLNLLNVFTAIFWTSACSFVIFMLSFYTVLATYSLPKLSVYDYPNAEILRAAERQAILIGWAIIFRVASILCIVFYVATYLVLRRFWKFGSHYLLATSIIILIVSESISRIIGARFVPFELSPLLVMMIYFFFLPIINCVLDFISVGFTRWAVRRGIKNGGYWIASFSLLDLSFTVILLVITLSSISLGIEAARVGLGLNIIDVSSLLVEIRENPDRYYWLYAALFSTAVPTALHFSIAIWSIGPAMLGRNVADWLAASLESSEDHFGWRWVSLTITSTWATFAICVPLIILVYVFDGMRSALVQSSGPLLTLLEWISSLWGAAS